jgi:hypothetical protein
MYCATLTMMVHSIRLYLMTLNVKQCTRSLNHQSLCTFAIDNLAEFSHLLSFDPDFSKFTLASIVQPLSEKPFNSAVNLVNSTVANGIPRSCIELRLPTKNTGDSNFPLAYLQKSFNDKLDSLSDTDQSIVFIDIAQPDTKGNRAATINFPVILRRDVRDHLPVMYQISGAIYWSPQTYGDLYQVYIVTRGRKYLNSIKYSCFEYNVDNNSVMSTVSKAEIEFPAIRKIQNKTYYLKGVTMFLNLLIPYCETSLKLPETDSLRTDSASGVEILRSNIDSLLAYTVNRRHGMDSWLDGSTINEVLASFAAFLGDSRNIALDSNALHEVIKKHIETDDFHEGSYLFMKDMFGSKYPNVYTSKVSCFHVPINSPERTHWNFALILMERRLIIVHDPMYDQTRVISIGSALFKFCKREALEDTSLMENWTVKPYIKHPQQTDNVNCGVFVLISSIRAMCLIKQNRFDDLLENWTFPSAPKSLVEYRRSFAKILLDDEKEKEFAKFVNMFS